VENVESSGEQWSPRPSARTIGVVYLLYFLTALLSAFLMKGLVLPGDAAATANSILTHEASYRLGFAADLIANDLHRCDGTFLQAFSGL
jgi:hypothetical protein